MTTPKTPYDTVRGWVSCLPPAEVALRQAKREGYLRCLADAQPRMDALTAALQAVLALSADIYAIGVDHSARQTSSEGDLRRVQEEARAALKSAGKE